MVNYSQAKVYKIVDNTNGNIYIGSTCEPTLARRLAGHVNAYNKYLNGKCNNYTSFQILENNNYDIVLLEACENITTKDELHARERIYIETLDCVNRYIPSRKAKEWRKLNREMLLEQQKIWRDANKDIIKVKQKEWRDNNKEKIEAYREANRDKIANYQKEHYKTNKDKKKKYSQENKDRINTNQKKYREANTEKTRTYQREYQREYRAKKKQSKELPVEATEQQLN